MNFDRFCSELPDAHEAVLGVIDGGPASEVYPDLVYGKTVGKEQ